MDAARRSRCASHSSLIAHRSSLSFMPRAVVFAYHNVGVRCLSVLLAHHVEVPLVVTHVDNPAENVWFDSVARLAAEHRLQTIAPEDPNPPPRGARLPA